MKYKNTIDEIKEVVLNSNSWKECCIKLNRNSATGNQTHLKNYCIKNNISYSHFKTKSWSKGLILKEKVPIEEYLENKRFINSHTLKNKLFKNNIKNKECEKCGVKEWLREECVFELHHVDNNHSNNNLTNLQILCPNCHALITRQYNKKEKIDKRKLRSKRLNLRKIVRPSLSVLLEQVKNLGYCKTGRLYNVSDNTIRKWIKWETAGMVDNSALEAEAK